MRNSERWIVLLRQLLTKSMLRCETIISCYHDQNDDIGSRRIMGKYASAAKSSVALRLHNSLINPELSLSTLIGQPRAMLETRNVMKQPIYSMSSV